MTGSQDDNDLKEEVPGRLKAAWSRSKEISDILESKLKRETKTKLFNSTVLIAMAYCSETWALTAAEEKRLQIAQQQCRD